MNILFVNTIPFNPCYGGIERVTDQLTKYLMSHFQYKVYYLICEECDKAIYEYSFPTTLFHLPSKTNIFHNRSYIARLVAEYDIDVIVNQRGQSAFIHECIKTSNVKIISVIHSKPSAFIEWELLRILSSSTTLIKRMVKTLIYPVLYYKTKLVCTRYFAKHFLRVMQESSSLVLLSNKYIADLEQIVGVDLSTYNIAGIPNPNTFLDSECIFERKDNIILYVGRLSQGEKNPLRLLKIWEQLYCKYLDWKLVIVGDGDAMSMMKNYIVRKKLQRVIFSGPQDNVIEYYKRADFICLTSNFEGWGMSLTEGMQCGCIPFTFNNYAAASDIIDDGINGCLIKPYDICEYASKLATLMSNDKLRHKMSAAAKIKVREFDIDKISFNWVTLFNR